MMMRFDLQLFSETGPKDYGDKNKGIDGVSCEETLNQAIELYQRGVKGDTEAVNEAYKLLGEIRNRTPRNNLINAYYGSVITLMGRDASDPMKRFEKTLKGLKILDQSVDRDPDNIQIRMLRANICARLPEIYFHRAETAIADFNYLLARYDSNANIMPKVTYYQILYELGNTYQNLDRQDLAEATREKLRTQTADTGDYDFFFVNDSGTSEINSNYQLESPDLQTRPISKILAEGARVHREALTGDKDAINTAADFFAKALALNPGNDLLEAYHADCLSLMGRDSLNSAQMFASAIKAMKMFDNIVNRNPENIQTRLLRANHSFRIPEGFFHRTAAAIADFEYIAKRYAEDQSLLTEEEYCRMLYELGTAHYRLGLSDDGSSVWKKLLSTPGGLKYKDIIAEQLLKNVIPRPKRILSLITNRQNYYQEASRFHELGVAGNTEAAQLAFDLWEKAHEQDPQDPLALAFYGSSLALVGRYATEPNTIFGNAIRGIKLVNQAVSLDENNLRIRLLRAFLAYSLPEAFFHLTQQAIKDFQFIKKAYEQDPNVLSKDVYYRILHNLGESYRRIGQNDRAKTVWNILLKDNPAPIYVDLLSRFTAKNTKMNETETEDGK